MTTVQATQRLIAVATNSHGFDCRLEYSRSPIGADFYKDDTIGAYEGIALQGNVSIRLNDSRLAYTKASNVV